MFWPTILRKYSKKDHQRIYQNKYNPELLIFTDSGTINFSEFQKMMKPKLREPDKVEDFRECFKVFDRDGNGVVTLDDLDNIFSRLGKTFTRHEMTDMLKAADVDGDKRVTFDGSWTVFNVFIFGIFDRVRAVDIPRDIPNMI